MYFSFSVMHSFLIITLAGSRDPFLKNISGMKSTGILDLLQVDLS